MLPLILWLLVVCTVLATDAVGSRIGLNAAWTRDRRRVSPVSGSRYTPFVQRPGLAESRGQAGFTLLELLTVIAIIGVLAALAIPRVAHRSEQARSAAARVDVKANLPSALDLFELDNGFFPTTAQGLMALCEAPVSPPLATRWTGPYLRQRGRVPKDPWGHEYVYRCPSNHPGMDNDLLSKGPDGVEGGQDDITSTDE